MDAEKRKILVAAVRRVDEAEEALRKANADLDKLVEGNGHVTNFIPTSLIPTEDARNGSEPPNNAKALLDYISKHRIVDYGQAAKIVYGTDTEKSRDNVQAKLYYLKTKGWVNKGSRRNEWEVTIPSQDN